MNRALAVNNSHRAGLRPLTAMRLVVGPPFFNTRPSLVRCVGNVHCHFEVSTVRITMGAARVRGSFQVPNILHSQGKKEIFHSHTEPVS